MAVFVKGKNGKDVCLLSPKEKGRKYADELRNNTRYTNTNEFKADKYGDCSLTKGQRAFRSGYLAARKDIGKAYQSKQKNN